MKFALALSRKRTSAYYGTNHWCKTHNQLVDHKHIDMCELIKLKDEDCKVSEIIKPLDEVQSLWDLENSLLRQLIDRLGTVSKTINELVK